MFDTSLVRAHAIDAPRRFSLLTISVALHSAVVISAIAASVVSIDFPKTAPDQTEIYTPVMMPSPPPLPLGQPAVQLPKPAAMPVPVQRVTEVTAPQTIPETIAETPIQGPAGTGESTNTGPIGVPDGSPIGIDVGQRTSGTGTEPVFEGPRVPGGEVRPARVLSRVEPRYPQSMINVRIRTAVVAIRCVIDREGKIRNPEITASSYPPFNESVLDAIRQWTFAPGSMRGQPIDTWFELKVTFNVR